MKFTFNIVLTGEAWEERRKVVLAGARSELRWHIALKLVGLLLFWEYEPRVEEGIGWHFKPDLVALDEAGGLGLWVDCGNISARKIDRVASKVGEAPFFILKRDRAEAAQLRRLLEGKVRQPQRVRILCFDDAFIDDLAGFLDATNDIQCRRSPDRLHLRLENRRGMRTYTTRIHGEG